MGVCKKLKGGGVGWSVMRNLLSIAIPHILSTTHKKAVGGHLYPHEAGGDRKIRRTCYYDTSDSFPTK